MARYDRRLGQVRQRAGLQWFGADVDERLDAVAGSRLEDIEAAEHVGLPALDGMRFEERQMLQRRRMEHDLGPILTHHGIDAGGVEANQDRIDPRNDLEPAPVAPLPHLTDVFLQAQDINPKLKGYLVLNMCPTNPVIKEADDAKEYLSDFPEFGMATTLIYDRKAFRDCVAEGKSVFEWKDAKAKAEISALMEEVFRG